MASPNVSIGIDIGGTFTDVVAVDDAGNLHIAKVPSTRSDPSAAVRTVLQQLLPAWKIAPGNVKRFAHGTTVATNAVLERKGARIGLLATEGFTDVIEIGRQNRTQIYDLILKPETPVFLAPGARRRGVIEAIGLTGEIVTPLDEASLECSVDELVAEDVEAIAICFLFSFLNPTHERQAAEYIRRRHPSLIVSISSEVDSTFREYERTVVTAFDAYVKAGLDRYLAAMEDDLRSAGIPATLQIMQSRGGVCSARVARQRPIRLFLSGPAAGVVGARESGHSVGHDNLITVDIGGTSSDIALIARGQLVIRPEGLLDGFKIRVPMVDVNSIGSGGGSIAWIDAGGGLRVGPQSAGAEPGPACYARGGKDATVTDASVVLGLLDPAYFAGGTLRLDPELAARAVEERVAKPLGLSLKHAALGIHRVVNVQMAEGIRLVSISRGIDPRSFTLVAFGGAGALHATALARELDIGTIIVPRYPGVLCASGLLSAMTEHEASTAFLHKLSDTDPREVAAVCERLMQECAGRMREEDVDPSLVQTSYYADVCYVGQAYHIEVPLVLDNPATMIPAVYDAFCALHEQVRGHSTRSPARFVNLRVVQRAANQAAAPVPNARPARSARKGSRKILLEGADEYVEAEILDRDGLVPGQVVRGPAIIEQTDTTTLVEPGWRAEVAANEVLILTREAIGMNTTHEPGSVDPITLEVVRNKLDGIANEMQMTLLHSAFSPIVKEGMDCSAALFTADGQTIAQATAIPIHLATMIPALAAVIAKYPVPGMAPGDVYILNDPYCGGTHLPDITLFIPVIVEGRALGFSVATVHHQDVGGMSPGSIPTNATEIYQEGLRIPPLKYIEAGKVNETLEEMLRYNIRLSDMFMGDLNAQLAACTVGARRLGELSKVYGSAMLTDIFTLLLDRSELMTREALRKLPQGTFHYVDWLDNDGVDLDKKVRIEVAVTIRDGSIHFDLTGTSPQVRGPFNTVPSGTRAAAYYAVRALTNAQIPTNGGCFRPVTLHLPEGSIVNPVAPAAVNARTATIKRICGAMVSALSDAAPKRVPAAAAGLSLMLAFGGKRADGSPFIVSELVAAGTGASDGSDGVDCLQTDGSNSMNLPIEAMGIDAPIRVLRFGLRPDSGGVGRHRGGLGVVREYIFQADDIRLTYRGERHFTQARGSAGGGPGAASRATIFRTDGRTEQIASKCVTTVSQGDRLVVETAGGAGFGNPQTRERDAVAEDIANRKVTAAVARTEYGY